MPRDSVPISIKPAITPPKHPIRTWRTEDCVERPCPPDSPCRIEIRVSTRFQFSGTRQNSYVVQQVLLWNSQTAVDSSGLQIFNCKAPPFNYLLPEVDPTKAEPASTIVKYPTFARRSAS